MKKNIFVKKRNHKMAVTPFCLCFAVREASSIRRDGSIKVFAGRRREKIAPINRKLHLREERGGHFLLNIDNWEKIRKVER